MTDVLIRALRPFNKTPQGDLCEPGDLFGVGKVRADELARLGLAELVGSIPEPVLVPLEPVKIVEPVPVEKTAPEPDNKMADAPANKMARKP